MSLFLQSVNPLHSSYRSRIPQILLFSPLQLCRSYSGAPGCMLRHGIEKGAYCMYICFLVSAFSNADTSLDHITKMQKLHYLDTCTKQWQHEEQVGTLFWRPSGEYCQRDCTLWAIKIKTHARRWSLHLKYIFMPQKCHESLGLYTFWGVPQPISREISLSISSEVIQISILIFLNLWKWTQVNIPGKSFFPTTDFSKVSSNCRYYSCTLKVWSGLKKQWYSVFFFPGSCT